MIAHTIVFCLLAAAAAYDAYVVSKFGLGSGKTVSWITYESARQFPAVGFIVGYGFHYTFPGHELAIVAALVCGHIFGTMRGA